ncbi:hypothetical protein BLIG_02004 [Bifidobacterium longum subsp. infantis CCUG 52486]|uniref:Uncharacterized protein n=1 Tax=Bifidobacterium longum subsp. infantis CCUG 52486 TaxID=537937 RepID=C5ECY1_BIFLI|nr:hypothetical protein BLIG_02004 [Bifidobacterium longum subsp. infantis CCUG 52486]
MSWLLKKGRNGEPGQRNLARSTHKSIDIATGTSDTDTESRSVGATWILYDFRDKRYILRRLRRASSSSGVAVKVKSNTAPRNANCRPTR